MAYIILMAPKSKISSVALVYKLTMNPEERPCRSPDSLPGNQTLSNTDIYATYFLAGCWRSPYDLGSRA